MIYARTASDLRVGDGHTSPVAERCPGVAPPPLFLNTKAQRRNEMRERFTRVGKVSSLRADARRKDMWVGGLPLCHFERSEQSSAPGEDCSSLTLVERTCLSALALVERNAGWRVALVSFRAKRAICSALALVERTCQTHIVPWHVAPELYRT